MSSRAIMTLEHRMALFLASTCGREFKTIRPVYLSLVDGASRKNIEEILMRRLSHWEFQKEHMVDRHDSRTCGLCNQLWDRARQYEGAVRQFVHDHMKMIAECELDRNV